MPNYNAVVERNINIQTTKAMVRALHLQSQLSGGYWPLTSSAARFILNRLPRTTNAGMITPYQAYFGQAPADLSSMRMFGSTCCFWISKGQCTSEVNGLFTSFSTARHGLFVGYDDHRRAYMVLPDGVFELYCPKALCSTKG